MGILAADRLFLAKIGFLDGGMLVYGGENVEFSLRVGTLPLSSRDKAEGATIGVECDLWNPGTRLSVLGSRGGHILMFLGQ